MRDTMIMRMKKYPLHFLVVTLLCHIHIVSQPHWYLPVADSASWKPHIVMRLNLPSGKIETFIPDCGWMIDVIANQAQDRLFLVMQSNGAVEMVCVPDTGKHFDVLNHVGIIDRILDMGQTNRILLSYGSDTSIEDEHLVAIDKSMGTIVERYSGFGDWFRDYSYDAEHQDIYVIFHDTVGGNIGVTCHNEMAHNYERVAIDPAVLNWDYEDCRNNRILLSKGSSIAGARILRTHILKSEILSPGFLVPWKYDRIFSSDGQYIITISRSRIDQLTKSSHRSGSIYVFESMSNRLKQRVVLPPGGRVEMVGSYPRMFYYFFPEAQMSFPINLDVETPVLEFIDTLRSMNSQALANRWLMDSNLSLDMDSWLGYARSNLFSGDSVRCSAVLDAYQRQIDVRWHDSSHPVLTADGWELLYFHAGYCLGRLPHAATTLFPLRIVQSGPGSVSRTPDNVLYDSLSSVTLTALPDSGAVFTGWSGSISDTINPLPISVTQPHSISANFGPARCQIHAEADSPGVIVPSGDFVVPSGASLTFHVRTTPHRILKSVLLDGEDIGHEPDFTLPRIIAHHSVRALITPDSHSVHVTVRGRGTVIPSPASSMYEHGTTVELHAIPFAAIKPGDRLPDSVPAHERINWIFEGWEGDTVSSVNPLVIKVGKNFRVLAKFRSISEDGR